MAQFPLIGLPDLLQDQAQGQAMDVVPGPFNGLITELWLQIFSEPGFTIKDLLSNRFVCQRWLSIIEDNRVGKVMLQRLPRALLEGEQWIEAYRRWRLTKYWIVLDTSNSMNNVPTEHEDRDIITYDETLETPWTRAKVCAMQICAFLRPVASGLRLCLFTRDSASFDVSSPETLSEQLRAIVEFGGESNMETAFEHIAQNTDAAHSVEVFVISDFCEIPRETTDQLKALASRVSLTVNCFNVGFYLKPVILAEFEKIATDSVNFETIRIDYDIKKDGENRERGPKIGEIQVAEEPPAKRQRRLKRDDDFDYD